MITIYTILSGMFFIFLAFIWSTKGLANAIAKTFFVAMAIFSVVVFVQFLQCLAPVCQM